MTHRPEAFTRAIWITPPSERVPAGFVETVRDCVPGDEERRCDCNHKKGTCHCSDSDSEWDPYVTFCVCSTAERRSR